VWATVVLEPRWHVAIWFWCAMCAILVKKPGGTKPVTGELFIGVDHRLPYSSYSRYPSSEAQTSQLRLHLPSSIAKITAVS
jgi:hypothetical protein